MTAAMISRLARRGINIEKEQRQLADLRVRHGQLAAMNPRDSQAERAAFHEARQAKRELFFRNPELQAIRKILFVKRQAFRPSHNLEAGHHKVRLADEDWRRIKLWIDCNCPLWPDYLNWNQRPAVAPQPLGSVPTF